MKLFSRSVFVLFVCGLITACNNTLIYEQSHEIQEGFWSAQEYDFQFEIADTLQSYDLVLEVDHDEEFYFQNLYTQFKTTYPSGKSNSDVVSLELSSKFGQWMGDCSAGHCQTPILLQSGIYFKELGKHQISISQHSRKATVEGIYALQLQLHNSVTD